MIINRPRRNVGAKAAMVGRYIAGKAMRYGGRFIRTAGKFLNVAGQYKRKAVTVPAPAKRRRVKGKLHVKSKNAVSSGLVTFSYAAFPKRKLRLPKSIWRTLAKQYQAANGAGTLTSAVGKQNAIVLELFSSSNVSSFIASMTGSSSNAQKYILHSVNGEIMVTNQELSTCRFSIYDVIAKRDSINSSVITLTTAWDQGLQDEGASANSYLVPGVLPTQSPLFRAYYKILRVTHGYIPQGGQHIHRFFYSPNRILDREFLAYIGSNGHVKGLTVQSMIVFHGMPCNDSVNGGEVSLGTIKLDYVHRSVVCGSYLQNNADKATVTQSLPTAFTNAEHIVDIGSGAVTNDTSA